MDEIKRSIDAEFQKAIDTLKSEDRILRAKEASIEQELNEQKGKTLGFKNDLITYTALSRDVESYRKLYYDTMERLREIKLTQASVTNNVKVVKRATVPLQPVRSKAAMKMMLGIVLSGCLGVGLAFIREYFDNRFKEAGEVEPYLQILFLGIVPHYTHPKHSVYEPVLLHDPASLAAETYRILRTRLQAVTPMPKTLIVTSAVPSEGKSTTTANLGIAFAQLGWNVLLVDADLRRPSLHRHFGRPNSEGLANVLADGVTWQAAIQETSLNTLKLLPAGFSTRNPADLLSLKAMQSLLETLRDTFDLVIFDAPLVFSIPDVEILAPKIDGALLVHAPDRCEKSSVVSAKNLLERGGVKVLGIVFNNIKRKEEQHYYQYHRYYSYGNNNSHQISQGKS
jgi:capsular exopolysaccharide synthesis family protein